MKCFTVVVGLEIELEIEAVDEQEAGEYAIQYTDQLVSQLHVAGTGLNEVQTPED